MKNTKNILLVALLAISNLAIAQLPRSLSKPTQMAEVAIDSNEILLDKALNLSVSNDHAAAAMALSRSVEAIEKSSESTQGEFKDKLLGQLGNLKKLIPLAKAGGLQGGVLQKAIALVKMALGANQLSSILGGKSLLGKTAGLSSNLDLMKSGLTLLGGSSAASGGLLLSGAMSSVNLLKTSGAAAEPKVRDSIGGVLNFAKGLI